MPRKEGQKLKLLTLLEIFVRETDEKHPISVPRMVELLKERGIVAERKSVYDDIQTLNEMPDTPFEIVQQRGRGGGYYMVDTPFELAELKLLVDAVYASKFITARKSKVLIEKHEGQLYTVSPWVMVWENGNYYMIAYTEGRLKHYRVDKMRKVELLPDTEREGAEEYAEFDVNQYMQQMFDMFNGPVRKVTMRCENRLAGAMIDRFGTGVTLVRNPDGDHFNVVVNVQVSPRFYGWVAGFGTGIEILDPPSVRAEMKKKLDELEGLYR